MPRICTLSLFPSCFTIFDCHMTVLCFCCGLTPASQLSFSYLSFIFKNFLCSCFMHYVGLPLCLFTCTGFQKKHCCENPCPTSYFYFDLSLVHIIHLCPSDSVCIMFQRTSGNTFHRKCLRLKMNQHVQIHMFLLLRNRC